MAKKVKDPRPSWDEYFMEIANVVAKRSNCSRRHVAAVIVKDRHILSSGYNGTPHGTKNCFEGGCPRCSGKVASGTHLDECLCVHAEQNAICQAAFHGAAVKGSTIYVTILVNGIPLVHCELKRRGVAIREAFNQNNRYLRESFWSGTGLFGFVQVFVISKFVLFFAT